MNRVKATIPDKDQQRVTLEVKWDNGKTTIADRRVFDFAALMQWYKQVKGHAKWTLQPIKFYHWVMDNSIPYPGGRDNAGMRSKVKQRSLGLQGENKMSRVSDMIQKVVEGADPKRLFEEKEIWIVQVARDTVAPNVKYTDSKGLVDALKPYMQKAGLSGNVKDIIGAMEYSDIAIQVDSKQKAIDIAKKLDRVLPQADSSYRSNWDAKHNATAQGPLDSDYNPTSEFDQVY